ncbi:MAG: thioesterase family protein [Blastomonas sp.]
MTPQHDGVPRYFDRVDEGFVPTGLARSPWTTTAIAGGPVSALLASIVDESGLLEYYNIARFSVDILGTVPHMYLEGRMVPVRQGRQMQLQRAELLANGRVVAQAHVLLVRDMETPALPAAHSYPDPATLAEGPFLIGATMAGAIRTKPVQGAVREPGRGVVWLAMDGEIIGGTTPSNFVKSALFSDFGNGVGSGTDAREWSYANLDITLQFLRMPVGEWFLIDAHTLSAGNGHATAMNVFADADSVYAHGMQTVFVNPGGRAI